jgi:hypothetical protein
MFPMRQSSHVRLQSQQGVSVQNANRVDAQGARHPAMSVLHAQHSLQDTNLASCEEQVPSRRAMGNLIFAESYELKDRSEKFKNQ